MDLDGFLKLHDAEIKSAESQADIAGKLASVALTWEQVEKAELENLASSLDIKWDSQAHAHLLRVRNLALQRAMKFRREGERLKSNLGIVTWLLSGGSDWDAIRNAWVAFEDLRHHLPIQVAVKAGEIVPHPDVYDHLSWLHPTHAVPAMPDSRDPGTLLNWARQHTCYPKWGSVAYTFIGAFLQALGDAAAQEAAAIQARIEAAEKAALELEQRDWDRLKQTA